MMLTGGAIALLLAMAGFSRLAPGFMLGVAAGMSNGLLLSHQLKKSAALPPERAVASVQSGWIVRLSVAVLLLILSVLFAQINFLAALAGFFLFQTLLVVRAVIFYFRSFPNHCDNAKEKKQYERGE